MDMTKEQLVKRKELLERKKELLNKKVSASVERSPEPMINMMARDDMDGQDIRVRQGEISNAERIQTAGIAGLPAMVAGLAPESAMSGVKSAAPAIGQTIGGMAGGYAGSVAGSAIGSMAVQGLESIAGNGFDMGTVAGDALMTALAEGAFRGMGKVAYGKLAKIESLKKGPGAKLDKMKRMLAEASNQGDNLKVDAKEFVSKIKDGLSKLNDTSGSQGAALKRFMNSFKDKKYLTASDIMELKGRLGDVTKFAFSTKNINSGTNSLSKEVGALAKDKLEQMAAEASKMSSYKELARFASTNKKVSKILKGIGDSSDSLGGVAMAGTGGTLAGIATGSPMIGTIIGGSLIEMRNPVIKEALFRGIGQTGVGRALTLATSYAARQGKKELLD